MTRSSHGATATGGSDEKATAVDSVRTQKRSEAALAKKQAEASVEGQPQTSADSPKHQGDKLGNAVRHTAKE